jgi:3-dehydroquinate synthase
MGMTNDSQILVKAGKDKYPVIFSNYRGNLDKVIGRPAKFVIISNPTVFALHGEKFIKDCLPRRSSIIPIMIGDGERYKNQKTANQLYEHFFDIGLGRRDLVISFGGGVVGDTAGFVAATFKRGVDLVQVPTTLLSMVDSSIGGKVGVNHRMGKNLIGAFYQPKAVIINIDWLSTLGAREMIEGLAEIIKTGFLSSNSLLKTAATTAPIYDPHKKHRLYDLIRRAIKFKAGIVSKDVNDHNVRAMLNLGHTFGHAIEKTEGFRRYRHGEAVLAGMAGAIYLSHTTGLLSWTSARQHLDYLKRFTYFLKPLKNDARDYLSPMFVDKKSNNGQLVFVLLRKIGDPVVNVVKSEQKIIEAINLMKSFVNNRGEI